MNLKNRFVDFLVEKYPRLEKKQVDQLISENLISPFQVTLTSEVVSEIQSEIKKYWQLRQWGQKNLKAQYESMGLRTPQNFSVCMSYDFHLSQPLSLAEKPSLDLIEVNTNASFLGMGLELYDFFKIPKFGFTHEALVQMFKDEIALCAGDTQGAASTIAIIDENPKNQKLYIEFLVYQEILRKHGFDVEILDTSEKSILNRLQSAALVYNRNTDFYLQDDSSRELRRLYNENALPLSPNPYEYFLLADKNRMIDWCKQSEIEKPQSLLEVYDLSSSDKELIWSMRKQLFFKPKTAFGGKQAYKGSSITRKVFDQAMNSNFIAQKLSVPPELEFTYKNEKLQLKYDLRCFAYQDQLQLIVARLYRGQITNLQTEGGGFACCLVASP